MKYLLCCYFESVNPVFDGTHATNHSLSLENRNFLPDRTHKIRKIQLVWFLFLLFTLCLFRSLSVGVACHHTNAIQIRESVWVHSTSFYFVLLRPHGSVCVCVCVCVVLCVWIDYTGIVWHQIYHVCMCVCLRVLARPCKRNVVRCTDDVCWLFYLFVLAYRVLWFRMCAFIYVDVCALAHFIEPLLLLRLENPFSTFVLSAPAFLNRYTQLDYLFHCHFNGSTLSFSIVHHIPMRYLRIRHNFVCVCAS